MITANYPLTISQLFYNNETRAYEVDGPSLIFPAFIKKSQVKFIFKTQNKPYAVIQDIPEYVSTINRSYDLEFEVIGANLNECIENYRYLHEFLKLMKSNYEKSKDITITGVNETDKVATITSYAINNLYLNSRANFRIELDSNPFIYNPYNKDQASIAAGNIYDILMTSFDYKVDESHGYFGAEISLISEGNKAPSKEALVPVSFSITLGGILIPENPNIYRSFNISKDTQKKAKTIKLGKRTNTIINHLIGETNLDFESMKLTQEQIVFLNQIKEAVKDLEDDPRQAASSLLGVLNEPQTENIRKQINDIVELQPKE